ncbi:MAG: TIGR03862 family flavoprotein [Akkermansiaceae bacterium]|jgi:hypothetical protein|nr:TIGR03862 family flavoprotein [Akkermansiaceae bacterium]
MAGKRRRVAIVGAGPAGLFAAESAARAGADVVVYEAQRGPARKFLVAGYGGLNLTHGEDLEDFIGRYSGPGLPGFFADIIRDFPPAALRAWAADLGIETFEQRTGRVYPRAMKAAPLVRAWLARLGEIGIRLEKGKRLRSLDPSHGQVRLEFTDDSQTDADAVVLALGGGSWKRTGSDGSWAAMLGAMGIMVNPLVPANVGWECPWPEALAERIEGKPLKNLTARATGTEIRGEIMLTRYGMEGGLIYQLGPELRRMMEPAVFLDLKPDSPPEVLIRKMESVRGDFLHATADRWKLAPQAIELLRNFGHHHRLDALVASVKSLRIPMQKPRPIDEAISSAGGVAWEEITPSLMLRSLPGVYLAGEMIDWEAPTGGYLIQACFATGFRAGRSAADGGGPLADQGA